MFVVREKYSVKKEEKKEKEKKEEGIEHPL